MAVMLNAALAWLHRGSRGLPSYLLLPSEAHLDVLANLIGVLVIKVGGAREKDQELPRLMRSSYWKLEQFEKPGQIAAALEDRRLRAAHQIPVVAR